MNSTYVGAACLVVGLAFGWAVRLWRENNRRRAAQSEAGDILANARLQADSLLRETRLNSNQEALKVRTEADQAAAARQKELAAVEQRLITREELLNRQFEHVIKDEKILRDDKEELQRQLADAAQVRSKAEELIAQRRAQLADVSRMSEADVRAAYLKEIEQGATRDAAQLSQHIIEDAKTRAEEQARRIITLAIQRHAGQHTFETTTATVNIKNEEMKGRIIGREGRNIRAFEAATGITVMIDDTPGAVVLSGFDPVRREIAREAMERLILDGRIHPTRIEEVVAKVSEETELMIQRTAEAAVNKLGLASMHPELIKLLGRLHFRSSFSQNILQHSVEVAQLMALMAAELRIDVVAAKRAGLLHDVGKALNHEVEGAHAIVGADVCRRCGESDEVVNAVASHHGEVPSHGPLGALVSAADAISASRPGARSETVVTYLKRVEELERIGMSFPGVDKCYALQAGRELRVMVQPGSINDEQAYLLARNIVRKIENDLQYPGQIRVTVVRETRCVEFAK